MNTTHKAGLTLATLLWATGIQAQSTPSTIPVAGTESTVPAASNPQVEATQGTRMAPANSPLQNQQNAQAVQTNQAILDAQSQTEQANAARANAARANPTQPVTGQAPQNQGVFGPSKGPGIFGPAATPTAPTVTTDIYGNRQPVSGTVQPNPSLAPTQNPSAAGQVRGQNPVSYDANGQPIPSNLYPPSELPRSVNPITPSGTQLNQPTQGTNSGTVTGR